MNKKVALVSFHTGYNYGTYLQALAMNQLIRECGFNPEMIWHDDSLIKGRDITLAKLFTLFFRTICHPFSYKKTIGGYIANYSNNMPMKTKQLFDKFSETNFRIKKMSYYKMKRYAHSEDVVAVVCGSDQIWKADLLYISPYYFLLFAPSNKKVAYAPSFGTNIVPDYNKKLIAKNINTFNYISVRENSGKDMIKALVGKEVPVVLDPTLAVKPDFWIKNRDKTTEKYILCYFLDSPTNQTLESICKIQKRCNLPVKVLPYTFEAFQQHNMQLETAGPTEFLNLIYNADIVITDSFHGLVFSVIFHRPFYSIERNHKKSNSQSTRITNLLNLLKLENRYIRGDEIFGDDSASNISFVYAESILEKEREKSYMFLKNALTEINKESI